MTVTPEGIKRAKRSAWNYAAYGTAGWRGEFHPEDVAECDAAWLAGITVDVAPDVPRGAVRWLTPDGTAEVVTTRLDGGLVR